MSAVTNFYAAVVTNLGPDIAGNLRLLRHPLDLNCFIRYLSAPSHNTEHSFCASASPTERSPQQEICQLRSCPIKPAPLSACSCCITTSATVRQPAACTLYTSCQSSVREGLAEYGCRGRMHCPGIMMNCHGYKAYIYGTSTI